MTQGAWRQRESPPTTGEMAAGIAPERRALWLRLTRWLRDTYGLDGEMAWTDDESGWVLRYRRGGRSLATLLPGESGGFGALVVVGPSVVAEALAAPLSRPTHDAIEFAKPYADGRWLWLKVTDAAVVDDIEVLLRLKAPPPRRPVPVGARGEPAAGPVTAS